MGTPLFSTMESTNLTHFLILLSCYTKKVFLFLSKVSLSCVLQSICFYLLKNYACSYFLLSWIINNFYSLTSFPSTCKAALVTSILQKQKYYLFHFYSIFLSLEILFDPFKYQSFFLITCFFDVIPSFNSLNRLTTLILKLLVDCSGYAGLSFLCLSPVALSNSELVLCLYLGSGFQVLHLYEKGKFGSHVHLWTNSGFSSPTSPLMIWDKR